MSIVILGVDLPRAPPTMPAIVRELANLEVADLRSAQPSPVGNRQVAALTGHMIARYRRWRGQ